MAQLRLSMGEGGADISSSSGDDLQAVLAGIVGTDLAAFTPTATAIADVGASPEPPDETWGDAVVALGNDLKAKIVAAAAVTVTTTKEQSTSVAFQLKSYFGKGGALLGTDLHDVLASIIRDLGLIATGTTTIAADDLVAPGGVPNEAWANLAVTFINQLRTALNTLAAVTLGTTKQDTATFTKEVRLAMGEGGQHVSQFADPNLHDVLASIIGDLNQLLPTATAVAALSNPGGAPDQAWGTTVVSLINDIKAKWNALAGITLRTTVQS